MTPRNFAMTPEGQELSSLCLDLGYKLEDCARDLTRTQINFLLIARRLRFKAENKVADDVELEQMLQSMKEG